GDGNGAAGGQHEFFRWLQYANYQGNRADDVQHEADQCRDLQDQEAACRKSIHQLVTEVLYTGIHGPDHDTTQYQQEQGVDVEHFYNDGEVADDILEYRCTEPQSQ